MDSKELEEKLERDNLTLKEHIMKLQSTIKQIKSEIGKGGADDKKEYNREVKNINNEDSHLKFSFNSSNAKKDNFDAELVPNLKKEKIVNKNVFKENAEKIRKEKEIIEKMEFVKKKANLKRNYSNDEIDENELDKFHYHYNNTKLIKKEIHNDDSNDEDEMKDQHQSENENEYEKKKNIIKSNFNTNKNQLPKFNNNYLKSNNLNIEDLHHNANNNENESFKKGKEISSIINDNESKKSIKFKKYDNCEYFTDHSNESDKFSHTNVNKNPKNNQTIDSKINNSIRNKHKNYSITGNELPSNNKFQHNISFNHSDLEDDSFEAKIKNLQNQKPGYKNNSKISKTIPSPKDKPKTQQINRKTESNKSNVRTMSKGKVNTSAKKTNTQDKNKTISYNSNKNIIPNKTKENIINNKKEDSALKNEISELRKEVLKLTKENQKLKCELEREKEKNIKFNYFAEEIIKFYE